MQLLNIPCIDGEDEASLLAHEEAMRKELRKSNPNWSIIDNKMSLTFPKRVKLVQEDHTLACQLIAAYPVFRHDGEVSNHAVIVYPEYQTHFPALKEVSSQICVFCSRF